MVDRWEFTLLDLPSPPGLNASYKIVQRHDPKARRTYSTLALTDAANRWKATCADALLCEMATQSFKSRHTVAYDVKSGEMRQTPCRDEAWQVSVYFRLVTSRADADAPIKLLVDAAIQHALGIDDVWVQTPVGTKRFAEHQGDVSDKGNKLIEPGYMHVVILVERISGKPEFNERAIDREGDLLQMLGSHVSLPADGGSRKPRGPARKEGKAI